MSERTIGITYGMIAVVVVVLGGLVAMVSGLRPPAKTESQPTDAAPVEPPIEKPVAKASAGAISFRDPENTQRYLTLQSTVGSFKKRLAVLEEQKTMPEGDLEASCAEIKGLADPLAGEPHPAVQKIADGAKRLCDYDRPLATIRLAIKLARAPGANRKAICSAAGRATSVLVDKKYGDDEQVKLQLAELGKACM